VKEVVLDGDSEEVGSAPPPFESDVAGERDDLELDDCVDLVAVSEVKLSRLLVVSWPAME
jgi:hypothetical protein